MLRSEIIQAIKIANTNNPSDLDGILVEAIKCFEDILKCFEDIPNFQHWTISERLAATLLYNDSNDTECK